MPKTGAIATPHYLASAAGQKALEAGGSAVDLACCGYFGQWALLKWGFTESRDQHDHSTPEIYPGVQS